MSSITKRQREALLHRARGLRNKEIEELMDITSATLQGHLKAACRNLHTTSTTQAVAMAIVKGLISPKEVLGESVGDD